MKTAGAATFTAMKATCHTPSAGPPQTLSHVADYPTVLDELTKRVDYAHALWECVSSLFMKSDERSRLLYESYPRLEKLLKMALCQEMVGSISCLLDKPTGQRSGEINLTILHWADGKATGRLKKLLENLNALRDPISRFRHKEIAHNDLSSILNPGSQTLAMGTVRDALTQLREATTLIYRRDCDREPPFREDSLSAEVDDLLEKII